MEDLKGHKRVLAVASLTEFGERYSYYVIQSLLIFFLIYKFNIEQSLSASLVGTVLSMVYISALVGGYIADKLISYYRAAMLGVVFMIVGSATLALANTENFLFVGLAFISISTGLIKSNIASFIGRFYDQTKASEGHRDFGFNIFYVGINLGSFFALFLASCLSDKYGLSAPFYSSLIVSFLVFINLIAGVFLLKKHIKEIKLNAMILIKTAAILCVYFIVVFIILKNPIIANLSIVAAGLLCLWILVASAQKKYWKQVIVSLVFFLLSILYWALYFQIFISILLFISHGVSSNFLGFHLGDTQFLSFESAGVLIFGFIMGKIWLSLDKKGKAVHDIDKFNLGFILMIVCFAIIWLGIQASAVGIQMSAWFLVIAFLILAISELCLSAIGLSLITKLAPKGYVSLYMGVWLVTLGMGGKLAGFIAQWVPIAKDVEVAKESMSDGLVIFMILSLIGVVACIVVRRKVQKALV